MAYEITLAGNGFILRVYTMQAISVGTSTLPMGRALKEELVFPNLNTLITELKTRLAPPAA